MHKRKRQGAKNGRYFAAILKVEDGLKVYIRTPPLEISLKEISNGVWKYKSGLLDQKLHVVPLDIYGIVLGSPYLYDRKAIFFR